MYKRQIRYVTAIGNIDRQVLLTVLLVAGVMLAVVGLIVMSSMIFINNVVAPVSAVSEAAKRTSGGSYGVQDVYKRQGKCCVPAYGAYKGKLCYH